MAITVADFLASYPEFLDAPAALVAAKIAEAQQLVPSTIWNASGDSARDLTQQATFLYAAHFLALSPYARHMALVDGSGSTLYEKRLDRLRRTVTSGFRVT